MIVLVLVCALVLHIAALCALGATVWYLVIGQLGTAAMSFISFGVASVVARVFTVIAEEGK